MPSILPMLAESRPELPGDGALPGGLAMEQKIDGFRSIVFARRAGRAFIQSRHGTDLAPAFPDIAAAAAAVGEDLVLDGELVVPAEGGRLDFSALQRRARRRGRTAVQAAAAQPAYLIVFDVLEASGTELLDRPYRERRALLVDRVGDGLLRPPFMLCPATGDRAAAQGWLDPAWGQVGIEGVVCKGLAQPYLPGRRAWIKVRTRVTAEAIVGGVTGSPSAPSTLLLGRYDTGGKLRLVARSTPLTSSTRRAVVEHLSPADPDHPWRGVRFSSGWGARGTLEFTPVRPDLVVEILADTAVDAGRYRHAVRVLRPRDDLSPGQVSPFLA